MSDYYELVVAGIGGVGPNSTKINFTKTDDGVRLWAWMPNEDVTKQVMVGKDKNDDPIFRNQIRAGVTLSVEEVVALGNVQTQYMKDNVPTDLAVPTQQLILSGKVLVTQPTLKPMAKLEVVTA